jgi:3-deoxy-7-phosphoheptulonate synthase
VDPSHATGKRDLVPPLCRAALAVGADGVIVEVHREPEKAVSDGAQSLHFETFRAMMEDLRAIAPTLGRNMGTRHSRVAELEACKT